MWLMLPVSLSLSLPSPRVRAVQAGRRERERERERGRQGPLEAMFCGNDPFKTENVSERTIQTFVHDDLVKDSVRNASSVR